MRETNVPGRWLHDRLKGGLRRLRAACVGDWPRIILAASVVAGVMSLSGGFGALATPLPIRLAYGEGMVLLGVGLGFFGARVLVPRPWFETRRILATVLMTLVVGLPMTGVALLTARLRSVHPWNRPTLGEVFPTTLATTAGIVVLAFLVQARAAVTTHERATGSPPARFLGRLPKHLQGARLIAVRAEDHYLRVLTVQGEGLILMRLADALEELEGIEGARTHRSWWVARDAVVSTERADGRATLNLIGGTSAPVSRAYVKALRADGWF